MTALMALSLAVVGLVPATAAAEEAPATPPAPIEHESDVNPELFDKVKVELKVLEVSANDCHDEFLFGCGSATDFYARVRMQGASAVQTTPIANTNTITPNWTFSHTALRSTDSMTINFDIYDDDDNADDHIDINPFNSRRGFLIDTNWETGCTVRVDGANAQTCTDGVPHLFVRSGGTDDGAKVFFEVTVTVIPGPVIFFPPLNPCLFLPGGCPTDPDPVDPDPVDPVDPDPVICGGMEATIVGTPGPDVITGTDGPDVIVTFGGADQIAALGGDDVICSGFGDDVIVGGDGNDRIFSSAGNDVVQAGGGDDRVRAGGGNDSIAGEGGDDTLWGGPGNDQVTGDGGDDNVFGMADDDLLNGGAGNDRVTGHGGDDQVFGGDGDDVVKGLAGTDHCDGGAGVDRSNSTCETRMSAP